MSDDPTASDPKLSFKERAKAARKAAYVQAKARAKERKAALAASPAAVARKEREIKARREAYLRSKERARAAQVARRGKEQAQSETQQSPDGVRREKLFLLVTTADRLPPHNPDDGPKRRAKLHIVKQVNT